MTTSGVWALAPAFAGSDTAACSGANAGEIKYSSGSAWLCYSSTWRQFQPGQSTPVAAAPSSSGYFVLTKGTYNGSLGGLAGANSTCLTELTTNTGWQGYSTAYSNGYLVSGNVFAFLCSGSTCNNLAASTTYYFANAGNASAGGASFTTNSSGLGPGDSADWAAANYFSGTYSYWSGRDETSTTSWPSTATAWSGQCSNYTTSSSGSIGEYANSAMAGYYRWYGYNLQDTACNSTLYLICYVNP